MNTDKIFAEQIANEYSKKEDSKVIALKKLDRKVKKPAKIFAYTNGIIMSLVLGVGMCLSMKIMGDSRFLGIVIGIIGILGVGINYPIYKKILNSQKEKYAYDIITLAKKITEDK